ncbi:conserved hypothetical protein [delta proteobacterium NaphS2]|nr:conserved hypothetical protein [delta proteobacterium NaphS2]
MRKFMMRAEAVNHPVPDRIVLARVAVDSVGPFRKMKKT